MVSSLVGLLYELTNRGTYYKGKSDAESVIKSGRAKHRFIEWVKFLGGNPYPEIKAKRFVVESPVDGYVSEIDGEALGWLIVEMGGGRRRAEDRIDYSVGLAFFKKIGDRVEKGEPIGEIYYNSGDIRIFSEKFLRAFGFSQEEVEKPMLIKEKVV